MFLLLVITFTNKSSSAVSTVARKQTSDLKRLSKKSFVLSYAIKLTDRKSNQKVFSSQEAIRANVIEIVTSELIPLQFPPPHSKVSEFPLPNQYFRLLKLSLDSINDPSVPFSLIASPN